MTIAPITEKTLDQARRFGDVHIRPDYIAFREDFFQWQYADSARTVDDGGEHSALAAFDDKEIAAISLVTMAPIHVNGQTIAGGWHTDWFADRSAGGVGLTLMAEQLRRHRFLGVSGQSMAAATVFGRMRPACCWFDLPRLFAVSDPGAVGELILSASSRPGASSSELRAFLSTFRVAKPSGAATQCQVEEFDETYDETWATVRARFFAATDRTSRYMNWRYVRHPIFDYQRVCYESPAGPVYFVWREERIEGHDKFVARICEIIGEPAAAAAAFPTFFADIRDRGASFADFFCSSVELNEALLQAGMRYVITMSDFDLPRLLSPLSRDDRKTLHFAYSFSSDAAPPNVSQHHRCYFTKGDSNQDRPNL
jgi:hypothetical protein